MKSIAAPHLSFLITFHQADSLSQTVMVISWERGETLTRWQCTAGRPFLFPNQETQHLWHPFWARSPGEAHPPRRPRRGPA